MGAILQDVADRIEARALENQGLSAAELTNSRGVIENTIAQNLTRNEFGIRDRDLRLAGEELRDARGNRFTSGVVKFDQGQREVTEIKTIPTVSGEVAINVTSTPTGAEVIVNATNSTKRTNTQLFFSQKELLAKKQLELEELDIINLIFTIPYKVNYKQKVEYIINLVLLNLISIEMYLMI